MDYIKDATELGSRIDGIAKVVTNLKVEAHEIAVSALFHASDHSDVTLLTRLHTALGVADVSVARREAFKAWVHDFSPIRWVDKDKQFKLKKKMSNESPFNLDGAEMVDFFTYKIEPTYRPFDMEAAIKAAMRLQGTTDKKDEDGNLEMTDAQRADWDSFLGRVNDGAAELTAKYLN